MDRRYPESPKPVNYISRFKSFREVFQDAIRQEFPEMMREAGFRENSSLEGKLDVPATGYVLTIPMEHLRKLQPTPIETRQERLFNSFHQPVKDLTGSLVNMSV